MKIFLSEAIMMAVLGSALGLIISQGLLMLLRTWFSDIDFQAPMWATVLSILIALLTSALFAWGPSRRAANLEPVQALQGSR